MAEKLLSKPDGRLSQIHSFSTNSNSSCINCAPLSDQLISVQEELKSAEKIISVLMDDVNHLRNSSITTSSHIPEVSNLKTIPGNGRWCLVKHRKFINQKSQTTSVVCSTLDSTNISTSNIRLWKLYKTNI
jgi:hypothetical protein